MGYNKIAGIHDTEIIIQHVPLGLHDLTIRLINKEAHDTVIDHNGNIIEDLYVVIESLKVDGHDAVNKLNSISCYHDNHGNKINTHGWLGFSQDFKIFIQTPGWYFMRNLNVLSNEHIEQYFIN
jgi:hypothetical protein